MFKVPGKQGRGLLVLLTILAIALSGCSSSSKTTAPGQVGASQQPGQSTSVANNGGDTGLTDANAAFASINSYKFSMILAGGEFGALLGGLGGASATGNAPLKISGTVVVKPEKASDITMIGMHIIEIGGKDYLDMGTGSFIASDATGSSMADGFAPESMFASSLGSGSGYDKVGSEPKNGVDTDHFRANASTLSGLGSALGVAGAATWTSDVWVAKTGGYPVSMAVFAKAADNSTAFEMSFDLTNVNDAANKITAPTNVMAIPS